MKNVDYFYLNWYICNFVVVYLKFSQIFSPQSPFSPARAATLEEYLRSIHHQYRKNSRSVVCGCLNTHIPSFHSMPKNASFSRFRWIQLSRPYQTYRKVKRYRCTTRKLCQYSISIHRGPHAEFEGAPAVIQESLQKVVLWGAG